VVHSVALKLLDGSIAYIVLSMARHIRDDALCYASPPGSRAEPFYERFASSRGFAPLMLRLAA
jgi:hypothetical protein